MSYVFAVAAAAIIALALTINPAPPPRHHIYWCSAGYIVDGYVTIIGAPCMYRTNVPRDI